MMTAPSQVEWDAVAAHFGVGIEQVRRDHLISHVLAVITATIPNDDVVFVGGTALSRTWLADGRLSEDVDLVALSPRQSVASTLEENLPRGLARSHGQVTWQPALTATRGSQPAVMAVPDGLSVQVQLISGEGYRWPTEVTDLAQRYSDAPSARLRVPSRPASAAAKLSAWIDLAAPRDLYDLWALDRRGAVDAEAVQVFVACGPFGKPPPHWVFDHEIDEQTWRRALSHQTRLEISAREALAEVRRAWLTSSAS